MPQTVLVTGGGGFLGRAIVERLVARGDRVRSLARGEYPELSAMGIDVRRGDLADATAVAEACRGCGTVYHVAALAGIWGRPRDFERVNVRGTENVIAACRAAGVPRLVFTSSPSVVFDGRPMEGANESAPYPAHYSSHYPRTKALAEQAVLAANDADFATVALRPHLIWGPRDNHLVPRIVARGRAGRLRRIGRTDPLIDSVYIDNAADAHLLAAARLSPGAAPGVAQRIAVNGATPPEPGASAAASPAGRAYFISNGEPTPLWELVNGILAAAGVAPVTRRVPRWAAWMAGAGFELAYGALRTNSEPPMTRFLAEELSCAHWFDISAARRDLCYQPVVAIREGLARLTRWFAERA